VIVKNQEDEDEIHIVYSGHVGPVATPSATPHYLYEYWQEPDKIGTPWHNHDNSMAIANTERNTYVQTFNTTNNEIYAFYRRTDWFEPLTPTPGPGAPTLTPCAPDPRFRPSCYQYEPEYFVMSSDAGRSWSINHLLIEPAITAGPTPTPGDTPALPPTPSTTPTPAILGNNGWNTIYTKAMHYEPAIEGERPEGVSIIFGRNRFHSWELEKHNYVFLAMASGNGYEKNHLYSATGDGVTDLGFDTSPNEYDDPSVCPYCQVFKEDLVVPSYYPRTAILTTENNGDLTVHVFFNKRDFSLWWTHITTNTSGNGWSTPTQVLAYGQESLVAGMPYDVELAPGTQDINLYIVSYNYLAATATPLSDRARPLDSVADLCQLINPASCSCVTTPTPVLRWCP
jgi:hypothetical protein